MRKIGVIALPGMIYLGRKHSSGRENILVYTFHPELTGDARFHDHFLNIVEARCKSKEG